MPCWRCWSKRLGGSLVLGIDREPAPAEESDPSHREFVKKARGELDVDPIIRPWLLHALGGVLLEPPCDLRRERRPLFHQASGTGEGNCSGGRHNPESRSPDREGQLLLLLSRELVPADLSNGLDDAQRRLAYDTRVLLNV